MSGQTSTPKQNFPVYNAASTGFNQAPDFRTYGFSPITLVNPNYMWPENKVTDNTALPDKSRILAIAQIAGETSNLLAIDIEHWPVTGSPEQVAESVRKLQTVISWYKSASRP